MTTQGPSPDAGLPRGRHVLSREQVAANQRARLMDATIELVGERGYAATTVAELVARAGVSRKAFYEHYANKQECFLATYDAIVAENLDRVASAADEAEETRQRESYGLETLFERTLSHRHRARLVLIEVGAVGPPGIARREQLVSAYEGLLRKNLGAAPRPGTIPNPLLRAVVGGMLRVIYTHVQKGTQAELPALTPDLVTWSFSYSPLPEAMQPILELQPSHLPAALVGGRAPGTLSPRATSSRRRAATRRTPSVSPSFVAHSQRERILDAVAQLSAEKGYATFTVEDIAAHASVSLKAFYEHFADKEDAFLVAYEVGHGKGLAIVERAFDAEHDWPEGVRAAVAALFDFLASEPAFAHMALVDALIATPLTAARSNKGMVQYSDLLAPGLDEAPGERPPTAVAMEAIAGGIFELCLSYTARGHISEISELVPWATYFALAPFVGAEKAASVATEPVPLRRPT
jgi:AcrR family transcriptional regulator